MDESLWEEVVFINEKSKEKRWEPLIQKFFFLVPSRDANKNVA